MPIKRYLGVDWGEKRIGLAMGDNETRIATPLKVVNDFEELIKVVNEENIEIIVLGVPFSKMEGRTPSSRSYNEFADKLNGLKDIEVAKIDERLTSKAADALLGCKKTKAPRDAVAAMLILQTYFDKVC